MKKLICLMIAAVLTFTVVWAESTDFSAMSDEELRAVLSDAAHELMRRNTADDGRIFFINEPDWQVYTEKAPYITASIAGTPVLVFKVVVVNNSDYEIIVHNKDDVIVNGWAMYSSLYCSIGPHLKKTNDWNVILKGDFNTDDPLYQFVFDLEIKDAKKSKTIYRPKEVIDCLQAGQ